MNERKKIYPICKCHSSITNCMPHTIFLYIDVEPCKFVRQATQNKDPARCGAISVHGVRGMTLSFSKLAYTKLSIRNDEFTIS